MKIGRLFLDVRGTISCRPQDDIDEERRIAVALVKELIEVDALDEIRISIVSTECMAEVEKYAIKLMEIFEGCEKVKFGYNHSECQKMHIGGPIREDEKTKIGQIEKNLMVCEHSHCYYADDSNLNRKIAERVIPIKFPSIQLVLFNPKTFQLHGLNGAIAEYLQKRKEGRI